MATLEMASVLKQQIQAFEHKVSLEEQGVVVKAGDGIATLYGLKNAVSQELLDFGNGL